MGACQFLLFRQNTRMTSQTPDNTTTHTDIRNSGWIEMIPSGWKPYILLMRLDRPIGTWLLLLPCWWSILIAAPINQTPIPTISFYMALFAVGSIVMRGAGCVINDLWDRDFDKQVERTKKRPLASGQISVKAALVFLGMLLGLGLLILLCFNKLTIVIGFLSLIPVILYPLAKRITWYPQAILGLTFNLGALMGATSILGYIPPFAWPLYIGGLFWTLGYDTIYAQQDMADDALIGVKSTALRFGERVGAYIAAFYCAATLCFFAAAFLAKTDIIFYCGLALSSAHLFWQWRKWDRHDPLSSLKIFRSNRDFGLIIMFGALAGALLH